MVMIDAGTGNWLQALDQLPRKTVALLCTHHFRDHSAGAAAAARAGIAVHVPEYERRVFEDPSEWFRTRESWIIYDNLWQFHAPVEPTRVAGVLRDYDALRVAGRDFEVIPLPGATITQVGLGVTLPGGRPVVFSAETIHSPGKVPRVAPLQYDYNGLPGAVSVYWSAQKLRDRKPAGLLPSLGEPILEGVDAALAATQDSLRAMCAIRETPGPPLAKVPGMVGWLDAVHSPQLERVTDHVWLSAHSCSSNWFVISRSGKALAIDYGYNMVGTILGTPMPTRRRALLHGLEGLKAQFGIDRVDVVLVSHYHDDHVCGIPVLQRLQGTECWAADNFADLLEAPEGSVFPCTWPAPMRVDRRLKPGRKHRWEEYEFEITPMHGHTRFSALIAFEADGRRFAHTGDQYFFYGPRASMELERITPSAWRRMPNHVYRNGCFLDSFDESGRWLLERRPDVVLQGHQPAYFTDEGFFRHIAEWGREYRSLHERAMPLGKDDAHFDVDSWGGWIWPWRKRLAKPGRAAFKVTVRNPFPRKARLEVRLVGPKGWKGSSKVLEAGPRAEVACVLRLDAATRRRRQPIAAELVADGQPFGQVAEALVTVGEPEF
jgi:glyoxylase-like metal-dependent hydrolase (beta-lactamase superfamily II)